MNDPFIVITNIHKFIKKYMMNFNIDKESTKVLFLLLLTDFAFILVHGIYKMNLLNSYIHDSIMLYSIETDRGYAEMFQYIKEYWIVVLLFVLAIKRKHIIYFAWSSLFMYFLLDDSLRIHESFGYYLAKHFEFQPMFRLRAQDLGELIVTMLFGLLLFIFIGVSYLFSDNVSRQISKHILILVMSLVFFGVVFDNIHIIIPWGNTMWGFIEDGGEMLVMSIIVWYVFDLWHDQVNHASVK